MIVPDSTFSCNGRITSYVINLDSTNDSRGQGSASVQVWHPTSSTSTEYNRRDAECTLTINNITFIDNPGKGRDYYLGNVSCTGGNRIEFQSGDIIGYHSVHYQLQSITNPGYTSYQRTASSPLNNFDTKIINNTYNNRQPLIQVMYGKIH